MSEEFKRRLADLLNEYCIDVATNTPDFILAEFVVGNLLAYADAQNKRRDWYGTWSPLTSRTKPMSGGSMTGSCTSTTERRELPRLHVACGRT
jgi:hypothetical protein